MFYSYAAEGSLHRHLCSKAHRSAFAMLSAPPRLIAAGSVDSSNYYYGDENDGDDDVMATSPAVLHDGGFVEVRPGDRLPLTANGLRVMDLGVGCGSTIRPLVSEHRNASLTSSALSI